MNQALTDARIDFAATRFLSGQFAIVSMMMDLYGKAEALIGAARMETDPKKVKEDRCRTEKILSRRCNEVEDIEQKFLRWKEVFLRIRLRMHRFSMLCSTR